VSVLQAPKLCLESANSNSNAQVERYSTITFGNVNALKALSGMETTVSLTFAQMEGNITQLSCLVLALKTRSFLMADAFLLKFLAITVTLMA